MADFRFGLDLGQARDFSAGVVVERLKAPTGRTVGGSPPVDAWGQARFGPEYVDEFHVRDARRWALSTPYPAIVDDVVAMFGDDGPIPDAVLVMDATGVGRGVVDMFRQAKRDGRLRRWPVPVTMTGGQEAHGTSVPKIDLVAAVQAALQQERLKIADGLPSGAQLRHELERYTIKVSQSGHARFEAATEADHDDLMMALALALWHRGSGVPRVLDVDGRIVEDLT